MTFDAGQTLIELDLDFLASRLGERGVRVAPAALAAASPLAWAHFDQIVDGGVDHVRAWHALLTAHLELAGIVDPAPHVAWLWSENSTANLWRKPIEGMVALARELAARGVCIAVLSNSEGRIAELLTEVGIADSFAAIIDSGRIGLEKPGKAIFDHTLAVLDTRADGHAPDTPIHIGDSWNADIVGARGAGWRAIWYGRRATPVADPEIAIASDAAETRRALIRWGVLQD